MKRRPPRSTRTDTLFPYTTLFRSPARDERPCTRRSFISILIEISIELAYRRFMTSPTQSGIRMPQGDQIWAVDALQALGHETRLSRSEEHTSELQSLMRISYAVFCLKKKQKL